MEFLQISAFVSLAQSLHMPLTAQELGVKLFDRVGRGDSLE